MLSTAAVSVLVFGYARTAEAQIVVPPATPECSISGTTATCTGDVSVGIDANAPLTTLNVNNLTQDIAPGSGVDGINFRVGSGNITIDSTANIQTEAAPRAFSRVLPIAVT